MDFFKLSKLFWLFAEPSNFLILLLVASLVLERLHRPRAAHALVAVATVSLVAIFLLPVDQWIAAPLENRFAPAVPPPCVDGILLLTGGEFPTISASRDSPTTDAAGRYAAATDLLRRYPQARLVISGGSPYVFEDNEHPEAAVGSAYLGELGVDGSRVTLEPRSRTTWENFVLARGVAKPKPGETWLLVTRAIHMPRAMGIAQALDWPMLAWPTDYLTPAPGSPPILWLRASTSLARVDAAIKEWIGLAAYRLTGRTAALLPAPAKDVAAATCPAP